MGRMDTNWLICVIEGAAGWLAALLGAAVALFTWRGGYIAPQAIAPDLIGLGVILGLLALSATWESLTGVPLARLLLALATLTLVGVFVISFVSLLAPSALLAVVATLLAFSRHLPAPVRRPNANGLV